MKPETTSRVMDMTTGETMGTYPNEYCTEWAKWRDEGSGEKSKRLLELEERYQVKRYKVTYELIEDD